MPFSLMNGLSAMGQGIATFAGTAGLEAQRADLAQQQLQLANQLATTRELTVQGQQQTFQAGQTDKTLAANAALETQREGGANTRNAATIAAENVRAQNMIAAEMARLQYTAAQPTADIKSAQEFSKLSPEDKQAYREQIATKAGLPMWMISPDNPAPPTGVPSSGGPGSGGPGSGGPGSGGPGSGGPGSGGPGSGGPGSGGSVGTGTTGTDGAGTGTTGVGTGTGSGTGTGTNTTGTGTGTTGTGTGTSVGTTPKGTQATRTTDTGPTVAPPDASTGPYRNQKALEGLPGAAADIVKGMVDGRISPPSSFAMAKPYWQGFVAKAAEYDPTFDQTTWAGRVATRKDFSAGQSARAITAMNTALGHAGLVADSLLALNNGSVTPWNTLINWGHSTFLGDAAPTNAREAVDALASEARRVFSGGGGGNLTELQEWQKNFPLNGSPEQQEGALRTFVNLMDSRLQALGDQYNRGMGRADEPITLLNAHAREVYDRLTSDHPLTNPGAQTGQAPASATVPKPPTAPVAPSWVQAGDQYSPKLNQARRPDGTIYGAPQ